MHVGHADSPQIDILAGVLNDFCRDKGIAVDNPEREWVAARIWAIYEQGARTTDQLRAALDAMRWSDVA